MYAFIVPPQDSHMTFQIPFHRLYLLNNCLRVRILNIDTVQYSTGQLRSAVLIYFM